MSPDYQLPPEFDLSPRARAAQRRLLEGEIGGPEPWLARRHVVLIAALVLGAALATPAFGLGQKLVEVLTPSSSPKPARVDKQASATVSLEQATQQAQATKRATRKRPKSQPKRPAFRPPDRSPHERAAPATQPAEARKPVKADLSLTMRAKDAVLLGDELKYQMTIRNLGPGAVPSASVLAALPAGSPETLTFVIQEAPTGGRCRTEHARVQCVLNAMKRGAVAVIDLLVQAERPRTLVTRATVSSRVADPRVANNGVTVATQIRQGFIRGSGSYFLGSYGSVSFELDAFGGTNGRGLGTFSYRRTYRD